MPGLRGPQIFDRLRARDQKVGRRVIFLTGDVLNERTQEFLRESQVACLAKPFSIAEFSAFLRKCRKKTGKTETQKRGLKASGSAIVE